VAASLVLSAGLALSRFVTSPRRDQSPIVKAPRPAPPDEDPSVAPTEGFDKVVELDKIAGATGQMAQQFGLLVDENALAGRWAYLDHDVAVAVRLLMDQAPIRPASVEPL
jgi:hypothetical protein